MLEVKLLELETKIAKAQARMSSVPELAEDPDYVELVNDWRRRADTLRMYIELRNNKPTLEQDQTDCRMMAERFIAAIQQHNGPRRLRLWQAPGKATTRIYFPDNLGFVSVYPNGDITTTQRGFETLSVRSMYPQWRAAYSAAIRTVSISQG